MDFIISEKKALAIAKAPDDSIIPRHIGKVMCLNNVRRYLE
jgi:hypothetical protein